MLVTMFDELTDGMFPLLCACAWGNNIRLQASDNFNHGVDLVPWGLGSP